MTWEDWAAFGLTALGDVGFFVATIIGLPRSRRQRRMKLAAFKFAIAALMGNVSQVILDPSPRRAAFVVLAAFVVVAAFAVWRMQIGTDRIRADTERLRA